MRFSSLLPVLLPAACLLAPIAGRGAPARPAAPPTASPQLPSKAPAGAALAIVNGEAVPLSLYLDRLSLRYGPEIRDGLIEEALLRQEAKRRGLTASPAEIEAATTENYRQSIQTYGTEAKLTAELKRLRGWTPDQYRWMIRSQAAPLVLRQKLAQALVPDASVKDADIQARYNESRALFTEPEAVRISHILIAHKEEPAEDVAARRRAQQILDRLRLGPAAAFDQAAKESSEDKASAPLGGKLPFEIKRGQNPYGAAFEAAVFPAPVGLVGEVVAAPDGYHVVRVDAKTPGRQLPLSEVKTQVRAELLQQQREDALQKLFLGLHLAAKIQAEPY